MAKRRFAFDEDVRRLLARCLLKTKARDVDGASSQVTRGSKNVFEDLGFQDAKDHFVKAELVSELKQIIDREGWTQARAAKVMGMAQPDVSRLLKGQFANYSIDRLMRFLHAAGCKVDITIKHKGRPAQTIHFQLKEAA